MAKEVPPSTSSCNLLNSGRKVAAPAQQIPIAGSTTESIATSAVLMRKSSATPKFDRLMTTILPTATPPALFTISDLRVQAIKGNTHTSPKHKSTWAENLAFGFICMRHNGNTGRIPRRKSVLAPTFIYCQWMLY
jgi:hypothetical protein